MGILKVQYALNGASISHGCSANIIYIVRLIVSGCNKFEGEFLKYSSP